jgi:hypothetical protein
MLRMSKRAIIAGLLAGVGMFVWSSIAHMATPLGAAGFQELSNEQSILGSLSTLGNRSGLYLYPSLGTGGMDQYATKLASSPSGILIYHPPGEKPLTPGQLITEFLKELIEALLAVYLLTRAGIERFGSRVAFVALLGVLAAIGTNISYWNWYGFPASYTIAYMATQIIGFLIAGLVAAFMLRQPSMRAAAVPA